MKILELFKQAKSGLLDDKGPPLQAIGKPVQEEQIAEAKPGCRCIVRVFKCRNFIFRRRKSVTRVREFHLEACEVS